MNNSLVIILSAILTPLWGVLLNSLIVPLSSRIATKIAEKLTIMAESMIERLFKNVSSSMPNPQWTETPTLVPPAPTVVEPISISKAPEVMTNVSSSDLRGRAPWVADMLTYVGVKETKKPGSTTGSNSDDGGIIDKVLAFFGQSKVSYCMAMVLYFLIKHGILDYKWLLDLQKNKRINPKGWSILAACFAPLIREPSQWPCQNAEYGDVVYVRNPNSQPSFDPDIGTGHVGFALARGADGRVIYFVAGNESDGINIGHRSPSTKCSILIVPMGSGVPLPITTVPLSSSNPNPTER